MTVIVPSQKLRVALSDGTYEEDVTWYELVLEDINVFSIVGLGVIVVPIVTIRVPEASPNPIGDRSHFDGSIELFYEGNRLGRYVPQFPANIGQNGMQSAWSVPFYRSSDPVLISRLPHNVSKFDLSLHVVRNLKHHPWSSDRNTLSLPRP
jgi:hypothetical protein